MLNLLLILTAILMRIPDRNEFAKIQWLTFVFIFAISFPIDIVFFIALRKSAKEFGGEKGILNNIFTPMLKLFQEFIFYCVKVFIYKYVIILTRICT